MNKIDDTEKYYTKFLVSDIKNKIKTTGTCIIPII